MANIIRFSNEVEFNNFLDKNERNLIIIHFGAAWAPQCKQINDILSELHSTQSINTSFIYIETEKFPQIALHYKISCVPTLLIIKRKEIIQTIKGGNTRDLLKALREINKLDIHATVSSAENDKKSLENRLKSLINSDSIVLFMKGDAEEPKCGFSRRIVQLLNDCGVKFTTFDILRDNEVREGLKKYSNWPTYPQLYVYGDLIGGVDIVQEMAESGELVKMIEEARVERKTKLDDRLKTIINKAKVVLFMKGTTDSPKCGFSRNTVDILNKAKISFDSFDILSDDEVRQGLKVYSDWPTYPQLYVKGQLVGGFDIIKEMNESGELVTFCNE